MAMAPGGSWGVHVRPVSWEIQTSTYFDSAQNDEVIWIQSFALTNCHCSQQTADRIQVAIGPKRLKLVADWRALQKWKKCEKALYLRDRM